jgi:hypothetical protein
MNCMYLNVADQEVAALSFSTDLNSFLISNLKIAGSFVFQH